MVRQLIKVTTANNVVVTFIVSCEPEELPEEMRDYIQEI